MAGKEEAIQPMRPAMALPHELAGPEGIIYYTSFHGFKCFTPQGRKVNLIAL